MTKQIYICGDSFGCPDMGWSIDPWPVILQNTLGSAYSVTNLSISCASNLLIRMQVDHAIKKSVDFVILLGTTCTRNQGQVQSVGSPDGEIYNRFVRIGQQDELANTRDLACYSILSLNETCVFEPNDIAVIKKYNQQLFNLDLAIYENKCIIESSLHTLKQHSIPFLFDQGGFENPMFGDVRSTEYFTEFNSYRSKINQWTLSKSEPKENRSHFHITNPEIHNHIADYYKNKIHETI